MIYREYHVDDAGERTASAYKVAALIDTLATTDDPELIVEFEERIAEQYADFADWAVMMLDRASDLEATIDSIDAEITRLRALKEQRQARAQRFRNAIIRYMSETAATEILTDRFTVSLRKNPPAVEVRDEALVPAEFRKVTIVEKQNIDKKAIAEQLKTGIPVEGCSLVTRFRLDIK